jgi:hypothetical protein
MSITLLLFSHSYRFALLSLKARMTSHYNKRQLKEATLGSRGAEKKIRTSRQGFHLNDYEDPNSSDSDVEDPHQRSSIGCTLNNRTEDDDMSQGGGGGESG